jgi:DNA primase
VKTGGRVRDEDIQEVRRRADLIQIASEYMQVKKAGRLFKALCPFHQEKSPSLSLDPIKGLYHCFGCNEGGDVYTLIMKLETVSFGEAVERLARRVGVELQYEALSAADRASLKRRLRLVDAHREAITFYHEHLKRSPDAAAARTYLTTARAFGTDVLEMFEVGAAPTTRGALSKHLATKGFTQDEVVAAGLARRHDDGTVADYFRGRIMFPIRDVTGDPIAFGARILEGDGPKYLNSAESPIYRKAHVLYALDRAKATIVKAGRALIVEGYTDVIALHAAGITEAVATCGTALGLEHLRTLARFTKDVVLSLDADEAGARSADRTYSELITDAQSLGLSLTVVTMPPGSDPADTVRAEGAEAFQARIADAMPLIEFVLRREIARFPLKDPEGRARALTAGLQMLARTDSEVVRRAYARHLAEWVGVDVEVVHVELDRAVRTGTAPRATQAVITRSSAQARREREAIKIALQHPHLAKAFIDTVGPDAFSLPALRALWTAFCEGRDLANMDEPDAKAAYIALSVGDLAGDPDERLAASIFGSLRAGVLTREIEQRKARLQKMNPVEQPEAYDEAFEELIRIEAEKRALEEGMIDGAG